MNVHLDGLLAVIVYSDISFSYQNQNILHHHVITTENRKMLWIVYSITL